MRIWATEHYQAVIQEPAHPKKVKVWAGKNKRRQTLSTRHFNTRTGECLFPTKWSNCTLHTR